ncbi:hypothetical protein Ndes2526A_g06797 [Nannochloris sp. 'desiccata']
MRQKLQGGQFRWLNEQLYTTAGDNALSLMRKNPELYDKYHEGFREQTKGWPLKPVDMAVAWLKSRPPNWKVADLGCGDATLATAVPQNVHSFDLISTVPGVIACNMSNLPLQKETIDVAVFCLSLMGTDYGEFLEEAARVLTQTGWIWIAEVQSRFVDASGRSVLKEFIAAVTQLGFTLKKQDASNSHFLLLQFQAEAQATVHTVITTECGAYFGWQSLGLVYSHRKAGQPGPLTRIMSCTPEEYALLSEESINVIPTHVAPSYTTHPRTGDVYSAYNKPVAVIDWLARNDVKEEYVLIIDADMIMRAPFIPESDGAKPGRAVSAFFSYMKGVSNRLALKHIPEVTPHNDTLAGPVGRRGDQVGGFTLMNTEDLRRVAPLWLKYTEDVRFDPDAWELTGDAYSTHPGDKPWISEMYGYSYACAKSNVWHICHHSAMLYPGYDVFEPPKVLHYGLTYEIKGTGYKFDKHWHYDFDPFQCPPWNFKPTGKGSKGSLGGLFFHPPRPSSLKTKGANLLRDLLGLQVPITLNAAFCERHRASCSPSEELERECGLVDEYEKEMDDMIAKAEANMPDPCRDTDTRCGTWATAGECDINSGFMEQRCPKACGICTPRIKAGVVAKKAAPELDDQEAGGKLRDASEVQGSRIRGQQLEDDDSGDETDPEIVVSRRTGNKIKVDSTIGGSSHDNIKKSGTLLVPELKLRCTRFPKWSVAKVRRCMEMANVGTVYEGGNSGSDDENFSAQAHHLLDKTHDVGRFLGEEFSKVHISELGAAGRARVQSTAEAAKQLSPASMLASGGVAALALALILRYSRRKRFSGGPGYHVGRPYFKHNRMQARED